MSAYDPGDGMLSVSVESYKTGKWVRYTDHERIVEELNRKLKDANFKFDTLNWLMDGDD